MRQELTDLRKAMRNRGIDACIIPTTDFHGSEYVNDYFKFRRYVSGFTGSAGTLLVTEGGAYLWTDGRYFIQAAKELAGSGVTLMKMNEPGVPTIEEFLKENMAEGQTLAFDGRVVNDALGAGYEKIMADKGGRIVYDTDLAGEVWKERPALKGAAIYALPLSVTGKTFEEKLGEIRQILSEKNADYYLITKLEETAWLFNMRGDDVENTPVFFSFTLVTPDGVNLYVFKDAIKDTPVPAGVQVKDYFEIYEDVKEIPAGKSLLTNRNDASYALINSLDSGVRVIDEKSPAEILKAVKNPAEIESTLHAHLEDGAAMVNFMYWLKTKALSEGPQTEITASDYLEGCRKARKGFKDLSFTTISGYGPNAALCHYSAKAGSESEIKPEGFLLVDSGGQYEDGTTDITRTFVMGPITDKMKKYFTLVLKSHIDLAMAEFKPGTDGVALDTLCRKPLKAEGLDFNHGTGHGVGHLLSVHEGPNSISSRGTTVIEPGMITSDEPGVYIEGEFGIRHENEILCVKKPDGMLAFETITYCPFDRDGIDVSMLTDEELEWLNSYHKTVYDKIGPMVDEEERSWLKEATAEMQ
jgi:Xaa-Pro aminopeptidase